jgi:GrpB-like predicted nucleotidyltransferase (UPF0157 family)
VSDDDPQDLRARRPSGEQVEIASYSANWPRRFDRLAKVLGPALGPLALRVEHIGSTAIPNMDAKDVLDIQVSVADLVDATEAFDQPLSALGFERGPYENDHIPAGGVADPRLWEKRFWSRRGHVDWDVNLQVRLSGSPGERLALLFRDWMRANPNAVLAYSKFKKTLAEAASNLDSYTDIKDPVVDLVICAAEPWADATGWRP